MSCLSSIPHDSARGPSGKTKGCRTNLRNYPLAQHRFARPAAKGLECADAQGRAPAFLDLTYEKQDSLGLKTWESFATEAGLKSAAAFGKCITEPSHTERIEAGVALGHRVGVHGTPTIIINGWRLATAPRSSSELSAMISRVAEGGTPVKDYTRRRF